MAHFAEIDDNNIVKQVIVVNNSELLDSDGNESEQKGIEFCKSLLGGNWLQTSYNDRFRKRFAGVGFIYMDQYDAFIPPKPYESWVLDEEDLLWKAPIETPDSGQWIWDESIGGWVEYSGSY